MAEEQTQQEAGSKTEMTQRKGGKYSESYRHMYGLRQDVLDKTRQLEWSLDRLVMYVRDLLR
jgi:hypothetical protein